MGTSQSISQSTPNSAPNPIPNSTLLPQRMPSCLVGKQCCMVVEDFDGRHGEGLFIYKGDFENDPSTNHVHSHRKNALFFTRIENAQILYDEGRWLKMIELPLSDPDLKFHDDSRGIWRANRVILGKGYDLHDFQTYVKFNLPLKDSKWRCIFGVEKKYNLCDANANQLDKVTTHNRSSDFSKLVIENAAFQGNVSNLDWLVKKGFLIVSKGRFIGSNVVAIDEMRTDHLITSASGAGNHHIIEWLQVNGAKLDLKEEAIHNAAYNNKLKTLEWWKRSGLDMVYDTRYILNKETHLSLDVKNFFENLHHEIWNGLLPAIGMYPFRSFNMW